MYYNRCDYKHYHYNFDHKYLMKHSVIRENKSSRRAQTSAKHIISPHIVNYTRSIVS